MTDWEEAENRVEKAHELFERGRWEEALSELKAAIAINPYNSTWLFNLGLTLDAMERWEEAIAAYVSALETSDDDDPEVLNCIGGDYLHIGRPADAISYLEKIEQIDPSYEASYCNRIAAYAELGDHDKAEEMFYLARQYKEKCPQCCYNMGHSLSARGMTERALWCWQQVLELEPTFPQVHAHIAEALWTRGELAEARQHYLQELRANPGDIDTLLDLGELLVEMDQPVAAAEKFRQTLDLEPDNATAHYHLGELAQADGDVLQAMQQFRRVLRIEAGFAGAHLKLAQLHQRQGETSEALYHANSELAQKDLDEDLLVELGNLLMDLGQLGSAEASFRRALGLNASNAPALHNLAVTLLLGQRIDEGIDTCKQALKIQPKYMLAMHNLALAYLTKQDYVRASYWLREALDIAPDDPQLRQLGTRLRVSRMIHTVRQWPRRLARK